MKKFRVSILLSIVWILIIFTNSLMPGDVSSTQSGFITSLVLWLFDGLHLSYTIDHVQSSIRIMAHLVEFLILGFLWSFHQKKFWIPLMIIVIVSVMDETIQWFIPGRAFELFDLVIDITGGVIGIFLMTYYRRFKDNMRNIVEEDNHS